MEQLPKQSDSEQAAPHREAANPNQSSVDTSAEKIIAALTRINRANRKADAAENERSHRREQRRFIIERIEIGLIAIYAIVTIFEWRTFDSERQTMEKELKTVQVSSQQEQRAWLVPVNVEEVPTANNENAIFRISFKNTGRTPALNAQCVIAWAVNTNNMIRDMDAPPILTGSRMTAPGEIIYTATDKIPNAVAVGLQSGIPVYVFGHCWYNDIFGDHHWSQCSYKLVKDPNLKNMLRIEPAPSRGSCDEEAKNEKN